MIEKYAEHHRWTSWIIWLVFMVKITFPRKIEPRILDSTWPRRFGPLNKLLMRAI